jgi:hypothetical protein
MAEINNTFSSNRITFHTKCNSNLELLDIKIFLKIYLGFKFTESEIDKLILIYLFDKCFQNQNNKQKEHIKELDNFTSLTENTNLKLLLLDLLILITSNYLIVLNFQSIEDVIAFLQSSKEYQ